MSKQKTNEAVKEKDQKERYAEVMEGMVPHAEELIRAVDRDKLIDELEKEARAYEKRSMERLIAINKKLNLINWLLIVLFLLVTGYLFYAVTYLPVKTATSVLKTNDLFSSAFQTFQKTRLGPGETVELIIKATCNGEVKNLSYKEPSNL